MWPGSHGGGTVGATLGPQAHQGDDEEVRTDGFCTQRTGAPLTEVSGADHMDLVDPTLDAWRPGARAATGLLGG